MSPFEEKNLLILGTHSGLLHLNSKSYRHKGCQPGWVPFDIRTTMFLLLLWKMNEHELGQALLRVEMNIFVVEHAQRFR